MKPVYFNGLRQIIGRKKTQGYIIYNYVCKKCGTEASFKKQDIPNNCNCGGDLKFIDEISEDKVEKILSRVAKYVCPVCNKKFDYPADCCIAKAQRIKDIMLEYNFPDRMLRGISWLKLD
jgi:hypothetical protein